jgi:hypothetical protein
VKLSCTQVERAVFDREQPGIGVEDVSTDDDRTLGLRDLERGLQTPC